MDSSVPRSDPGHAMVAAVDAARGWLRLLAARQLPSRLRPKVAPSDLVQQTVLEAYLGAARFEGHSLEEVYGWLRRILKNNVHDAVRQYHDCQARDVRLERPLEELGAVERDDPALRGGAEPHAAAMRHEEDRALEDALRLLPEMHARVIRLRSARDLTWNEIGTEVGCSGDAVRKIWGRSILRLQESLAKRGGRDVGPPRP